MADIEDPIATIRGAVENAKQRMIDPDDETFREIAAELARRPRNDLGNAERLLARHGHDILYVREIGWHVWDGRRWSRDGADAMVKQKAHATAKSIIEEAAEIENDPDVDGWGGSQARKRELAQDMAKWCMTSGNKSKIDAMISEATPYAQVPPDAMDVDRFVVNFENGTMRLEGACEDLMPHNRDDRLAKIMPVEFDPNAACPTFDLFWAQVQPDPDVRGFLQRYVGYCMTGHIGEQKLVFNYGEGGNGKSVLIDLIAKILGPYAATLPFSSLTRDDRARGAEATPDLARLPGVRFVRVAEPERNSHLAEAKVKSMTGGEEITARHLNQGFFDFAPHFKLMLSGNHKPRITGNDRGIWRRMLLVPWEVNLPPEQQDKNLPEKLWAERSGVLNWMLDGARLWLEQGLNVPAKIRDATDGYKADSDPLGRFIDDCIVRDASEEVIAMAMYTAYQAWCSANGEFPWKQAGFGRALSERGFNKERRGGVIRYEGVRLENVPRAGDDDDDDGRG